MEATLKSILEGGDFAKIESTVTNIETFENTYDEIKKQYEVKGHTVMDSAKRQKKEVNRDAPAGTKNLDGTPVETITDFEEVVRVPVPFQKQIVARAAGFLFYNPVTLKPTFASEKPNDKEKQLFSEVQKLWNTNKLDFFNRKLARILFSEREVAELWYFDQEVIKIPAGITEVEEKQFKFGVKMLANSEGDTLYPYFDEYGDLVAFSRKYSRTDSAKNTTQYFDIYTDEFYYFWVNNNSAWVLDRKIKNRIGKIPVIYYRQDQTEWEDVQPMIERFEECISDHGDTNQYNSDPIILVEGQVAGWAKKGTRGKVLELTNNSKASYLSWDNQIASSKEEKDTLKQLIYSGTQTPDISFAEMRNIGNVSGVSIASLFIDPHMKAMDKTEIFGEMFQRRLSIMKAGIGKVLNKALSEESVSLEIKPVFNFYLPQNAAENVTVVSQAKNAGIVSTQTAIEMVKMVENPVEELKRIQDEKKEDMGRSFE